MERTQLAAKIRFGLAICSVAIALAGCGDDDMGVMDASSIDGSVDGASDGQVEWTECVTIDRDAIDARPQCTRDDHCPCGSHCDLGFCEAECFADSECDSGVCDPLGRCRGPGATSLSPAQGDTEAGNMIIDRPQVHLADTGEGQLLVRVAGGTGTDIRVIGRSGAEIECRGTWQSECDFSGVMDSLTVEVRRDSEMEEEEIPFVRIRTARDSALVTMVRADQLIGSPAPMEVVEAGDFAGTFEGNARLTRSGLGAHSASVDGGINMPLSAELYGSLDSSPVLVIDDPYHLLSSAGRLYATLTLSEDSEASQWSGTASVPVQPFLEGAIGTSDYAAVIDTLNARVVVRANPMLIDIELDSQVRGLGPELPLSWSLTFARSGEASGESLPAEGDRPTDALIDYDPATVAAERLSWESALSGSAAPYASLSAAGQVARMRGLLYPEERDLGACFEPTPEDVADMFYGVWDGPDGSNPEIATWADGVVLWRIALTRNPNALSHLRYNAPPTITETPSLPRTHLACRATDVDAATGGVSAGAPPRSSLNNVIDICGRLRARTGCEVQPVSGTVGRYRGTWDIGDLSKSSDGVSYNGASGNFNIAQISHVCVLPQTPPWCTSAIMCAEAEPGSTAASVNVGTGLATPILGVSGDASCSGSVRTGAIPIDQASESAVITVSDAIERQRAYIDTILTGSNPLGIEEDDVPLYFLDEGDSAGQRFSAVSDFLLGSGPGSDAWAPSLVASAADLLAEARQAYIEQEDRSYLIARDEREHTRWVGEVRDDYNAQLRDYCGPVETSLIDNPEFNAVACAVNRTDSSCVIDPGTYYATWSDDDIRFRFCVGGQLRNGNNDDGLMALASEYAAACPGELGAPAFRRDPCPDDASMLCLFCPGDAGVPPLELTPYALGISPTRSGELEIPGSAAGYRTAAAYCQGIFPNAIAEKPVPRDPLETPGCVRGTLGEAYLDVVTANSGVQSARAAYMEHLEAYDIATTSCQFLAEDNATRQQLRRSHESNMLELVTYQAIADSTAAVAGGAKDCLATLAGIDKTDLGLAVSVGLSAASCAAGAVEVGANIASIAIGTDIERVSLEHENAVATLDEASEERICYNDARAELVGMRSAVGAIEQAIFDLNRATATVTQELQDADRIWEDGHNYLREIEDFPVRPPGGDVWGEARITQYGRRMRLARRAVYLAVRAVSYEYQASLSEEGLVLAAETPDELEVVLSALWSTVGTRNIGGSRPNELHVVLSLRDDVLRIEAGSSANPLTKEARFRLALSDPQYAVYDEEGGYLGQRVPFVLQPLGALGMDTGGVPIYGTNDCAERLWSVNASILGSDVYAGAETNFLRMDLMKENTFSSQWCGDAPEGEALQTVSVRPSRNLFREPGSGEVVGGMFGTENEPRSFTRARIQAFLGVDRSSLEDPSYANGESTELATRGLFGDYAIFIPAEIIAEQDSSGRYSRGLVIDHVDDILLRLDYVSVAR